MALGTYITVDNQGNPWVVNVEGRVFQKINGTWIQRGTTGNPLATRVSAGPDGQIWIIGSSPWTPYTFESIYKWTGSTWDWCDNGLGVEIERGNGFTLVVNSSGQIWKGTP